jgi:flavin reductase (DIM6/NTAB) family NADH-FMN oxidoreductase RutF
VPFTTRNFKDACHHRATGVAILTTPFTSAGQRIVHATVITEHAAAFPPNEADECYVTATLRTDGSPLRAIREGRYFGLSFLRRSQINIAEAIYHMRMKEFKKIKWSERHLVPFLDGCNAAILCSLKQDIPIGPNTLIVGHVLDVVLGATPSKPLVNYSRTFRTVDDNAIPVTHPRRGPNDRL